MRPLNKWEKIRGCKEHIQAGLGCAIDLKADYEPLYLPFSGIIKKWQGIQGGNWLTLTRENGDKIKFAHLDMYWVGEGYHTEGTVVASTGNTGTTTTGPHLHLETWVNGERTDPEQYNFNTMIGKIKYIIFKDTPINTEQTKTVMSLVSDWLHTATEGKLQVEFDIQEVDFKNDSARKIEWTTRDNVIGGYIPDWWLNRESNYLTDKFPEYRQALYLIDDSNWSPYLPLVGGFNKGVVGFEQNPHTLKGMDFVRWSDLISKHLNKPFNEGLRIAITEEFAHDLDNWGEKVEPKLDLPTFFDVASKPLTSDGSRFDSYVVHARDSRYPRWEHEHIFNKLKEYLAQWFECAECKPLLINNNDMKLYQDSANRVWAVQGGKRFWLLDPATRDALIKVAGEPSKVDLVYEEYAGALGWFNTDKPK